MSNIKEKVSDIIAQIELIKDIEEGDKIYIFNDVMYYQKPHSLQTIYRTLAGESRQTTFVYLESFLARYIHSYHVAKRNRKLMEGSLYEQLHIQIPYLHRILETLKKTYPDNHREINNLINFFSNSL